MVNIADGFPDLDERAKCYRTQSLATPCWTSCQGYRRRLWGAGALGPNHNLDILGGQLGRERLLMITLTNAQAEKENSYTAADHAFWAAPWS